jgi:hypothetical protein
MLAEHGFERRAVAHTRLCPDVQLESVNVAVRSTLPALPVAEGNVAGQSTVGV